MAPHIQQIRLALQITIPDAAQKLGLNEADYQAKESGSNHFTKEEWTTLYNYFTSLIEKAPQELQQHLESIFL